VIARLSATLVSVVLVGGALAGCSHGVLAGRDTATSAPSAVTTSIPSTAPAGSDSSLQSVQGDLGAADSATANAGGDVADADSAASTNDSP
jgi:hypothetical protein